MKTKHTPGPWVLSKTVDYQIESSQASICNYHVSEISEGQDLANARLIASAPELLEALEVLTDRLAQGAHFSLSDADLHKAIGLIRKARGES